MHFGHAAILARERPRVNASPQRTILAEGRFLRLVRDDHWEYADRTRARGAVVVAAVTDDRRLLLTEQFRIPVSRRVIELPAGLVGDIAGEEEEELATAASRELLEETGYQPGKLQLLTIGPPSAGMASEIVAFFLAGELLKVHDGGGDDTEEIVVHAVPLAEIDEWLARQAAEGLLIDPKVYAGLYFATRA
jgi:ADP-ribose pyrophosphatase